MNCYYCLEGFTTSGEYIYYTDMNLNKRTYKYSTNIENSHHFTNKEDAEMVKEILEEMWLLKLEVIIHRETEKNTL